MRIEDFWNLAFLSSLSRLTPEEAKKQADEATGLAIQHWQSKRFDWLRNTLRAGKIKTSHLCPEPIRKVQNSKNKHLRQRPLLDRTLTHHFLLDTFVTSFSDMKIRSISPSKQKIFGLIGN